MSDTLLPPNATVAERAMEMACAVIEDVPTPARTMWSPQNVPAALLPWLAWSFSVDTWDTAWTEAQKRATIAASFGVHRRKGTIGAVRRALAALGLGVDIIEWFQETPKGEPYTFRVVVNVDQDGAGELALAKALEVVASAKNLRSHLASVDVHLTSPSTLYTAGTVLVGSDITIDAWAPRGALVLTENGLALVADGFGRMITE